MITPHTSTEREPLQTQDNPWQHHESGLQPELEHNKETIFSVGNGYIGVRGSIEELCPISLPGTFLAGLFDNLPGKRSQMEMVVLPNWLLMELYVEDEPISVCYGETLSHERTLDMLNGTMHRVFRHKTSDGKITRIETRRFASLAEPHLLCLSYRVTPENYSLPLTLISKVSGNVHNRGNRAHWDALPLPSDLKPSHQHHGLSFRTKATKIGLGVALANQFTPATTAHLSQEPFSSEWETGDYITWHAEAGQTYTIHKYVSFFTDIETSKPCHDAAIVVSNALRDGYDSLLKATTNEWRQNWRLWDVAIHGDPLAQKLIRFAMYHLFLCANPLSANTSVGARGLTGEAYMGHIFWDTEVFVFPFLMWTQPNAAKDLLMYRYDTLNAARAKAHDLGYRGALYAWESTLTGQEETPPFVRLPHGEIIPIYTGVKEHHISANVAYAVWRFWQVTQDDAFFLDYGSTIILETARFWASRAEIGPDGLYHIRDIIGPDEYHEPMADNPIDDNAYTNWLARWNLQAGLKTLEWLKERDPARCDAWLEEIPQWKNTADAMVIPWDKTVGLIEQFDGFFDKEYIHLPNYEPHTVPMDVILGRESLAQTQIIKQADVLMLFALFPQEFPDKITRANWYYYEPRTSHGSSLSPAMHSLVAARLGDMTKAYTYFLQSGMVDLANNMGNASGGIHIAAMGGLWQAIFAGFAGISLNKDAHLHLHPHLPPQWQALRVGFLWRGNRIIAAIHRPPEQPLTLRLYIEGEANVPVILAGNTEPTLLAPNQWWETTQETQTGSVGLWTVWRNTT